MKYTIMLVVVSLITIFLIWGAFWVNFPAGNIGWGIYDLVLIIQMWAVGFIICKS